MLTAATAYCADASLPAAAWPDGTPQQIREDIFGIRFRVIREIDGNQAGLEFVKKAYARQPVAPEAKAYMGWIHIFAKEWGYPEMENQLLGARLVTEAMNEGSTVGCDVLARAMDMGVGGKSPPFITARMLRTAADRGATISMGRLALFYALGYGVPQNLAEADRLARRAADLGTPFGLFAIGDAYANGQIGGKPDQNRALDYYYEAASHGYREAWKKLADLADQGVPKAELFHLVGYFRHVNRVNWYAPSFVREKFKRLIEIAGDNPDALVEIGLGYLQNDFVSRNYAKAHEYFARAAARGNAEAKFYLAEMRLRGLGQPADRTAFQEMIQMADAGIADAQNWVGYTYYWGKKDVPGLKEDREKAFAYIRKAAEQGHPIATLNLGYFYEHGIGTRVNYALAAKVYWELYFSQLYLEGRDRTRSLLPFIK